MAPRTRLTTASTTRKVSAWVSGWARGLLVAFAIVLGVLVLKPGTDHGGNIVLVALTKVFARLGLPYEQTFYTLEFLANIVLFVPLGLLVPLAIGRLRSRVLWLTVLLGFVLSACIELAQLAIPGRVSDVRDVMSNTLGTVVGVLVVWALRPVVAPRIRARRGAAEAASV